MFTGRRGPQNGAEDHGQRPLGVCGVVLVREGEERPARPKVHICQLPILSKESINVGLSEIMGQPTNPQLVRHMLNRGKWGNGWTVGRLDGWIVR